MFNWVLDILAARSASGTKRRAAYYDRRAALVQSHNGLRHARNSIPAPKAPKVYTIRTPRAKVAKPVLKSVA